MGKPKNEPPASDEIAGCFLLTASSIAVVVFGFMSLGTLVPTLAVIGFQAALVALLASAFVMSSLAVAAHWRARRRSRVRAKGADLDRLGCNLGVERMWNEPDERYQERIERQIRGR